MAPVIEAVKQLFDGKTRFGEQGNEQRAECLKDTSGNIKLKIKSRHLELIFTLKNITHRTEIYR